VKILLDHNLDWRIAKSLGSHQVTTTLEMMLDTLKNGRCLAAISHTARAFSAVFGRQDAVSPPLAGTDGMNSSVTRFFESQIHRDNSEMIQKSDRGHSYPLKAIRSELQSAVSSEVE
jgi:hypothetical protein